MAKQEVPNGLFIKVVNLIRKSNSTWTKNADASISPEEDLNKQAIKEMMERKGRNDFVRKREFDMLRKMRKRETSTGKDNTGRVSFFQTSMPSVVDDRASTLKKINEIEAQMSMQWWNSKKSANPPPPSNNLRTTSAFLDQQTVVGQEVNVTQTAAIETTGAVGNAGGADALVSSGSNLSVPEVSNVYAEEIMHDAEFQEASIRFASGDDSGAEAGLLEVLKRSKAYTHHEQAWRVLFDLYRATGQQDKFEKAAVEFVEIFNRSAPQWFSIPAMVGILTKEDTSTADWICPSSLGLQGISVLQARLKQVAQPWCLDWNGLKVVEANAAEPLLEIFATWAAEPVQLRFLREERLLEVLRKDLVSPTAGGVQDSSQNRWKLFLEVLRMMNLPEEFELVALDFCVAYEISPPAWKKPRCIYRHVEKDIDFAGQTIIGNTYRDSTASSHLSFLEGDTMIGGIDSQTHSTCSVDLAGQVQGDVIAVLDKLDKKMVGANNLQLSCAKLIRVDFSAAGTLLNWVSAREAENRKVQFLEVHRLVASFFDVIGITEHAQVIIRAD